RVEAPRSRAGPGSSGWAAAAVPAGPGAAAGTGPVAGSVPCRLGRQSRQARTAPGPDARRRERGRAMTAGKLEDLGGRWRLRFTRELAHPQEKVWRAITEPKHMQ